LADDREAGRRLLRGQPLPPEFLVLGLQPEPWTPADSKGSVDVLLARRAPCLEGLSSVTSAGGTG